MSVDSSLDIEWIAQDPDSLAHITNIKVGGHIAKSPFQAASSPHRSVTRRGLQIQRKISEEPYSPIIIAGETLKLPTLRGVGYDKNVTDDLLNRIKSKMVSEKINITFPRIPSQCTDERGMRINPPEIDDLRASALVGVQLDANADLITPPIPYGIQRWKDFQRLFERTRVEIQTFNTKSEMIGFIPTTDNLQLVRDMVREYAKYGCHFFAVDFSGSSNQPSLIRTIVRAIRESFHIKIRAKEIDEKYYLHIFDVTTSKKSTLPVSSISDLIVHPYGVDSTSGQMWGRNEDDTSKMRYYLTEDYGAYRMKAIQDHGPSSCECPICKEFTLKELYSGSAPDVYTRLREHRLYSYTTEYRQVAEKISVQESPKGYVSYLGTKTVATREIGKIMEDVGEIRASL